MVVSGIIGAQALIVGFMDAGGIVPWCDRPVVFFVTASACQVLEIHHATRGHSSECYIGL